MDGRGVKVPEYPNGNWVGPSIVECTTEMSAYKEEIFGPVLTIVKADTFDDALNIVNRNRCKSYNRFRGCLTLSRRKRNGHLYSIWRYRSSL